MPKKTVKKVSKEPKTFKASIECDPKVFAKKCDITPMKKCSSGGGAFYFFGFLGAAVYYISTATGFWDGVWGFIKAIFWPAFVVHGLLKFLGI